MLIFSIKIFTANMCPLDLFPPSLKKIKLELEVTHPSRTNLNILEYTICNSISVFLQTKRVYNTHNRFVYQKYILRIHDNSAKFSKHHDNLYYVVIRKKKVTSWCNATDHSLRLLVLVISVMLSAFVFVKCRLISLGLPVNSIAQQTPMRIIRHNNIFRRSNESSLSVRSRLNWM